MQTVLVPGVAWPEYKPPPSKRVVKDARYPNRDPDSVTGRVEKFVLKNQGLTWAEIAAGMSKELPERLVHNALDRLWRARRLKAEIVLHKGRFHRRYYKGERA